MNTGLVSKEKFEKLIESIGFKYNVKFFDKFSYKGCIIHTGTEYYDFFDGSNWNFCIQYTNFYYICNNFKKEFRSIKLKHILE